MSLQKLIEKMKRAAKKDDLIVLSDKDLLKLCEASEVMREELEELKQVCICTRNTKGFDYGEKHLILGKPKVGSRWLIPNDRIKNVLNKADQICKE